MSAHQLTAQLTWSTASTGNITVNVCQEEDTIRVIMNNVSGVDMATDSLVAQLPAGVFFVPGSLREFSGFNVTLMAGQSTPNKPTFTFKNLTAVGGTINFSFRVHANCEAITHFEAGGGFRNTYTYYHDGTTEPAHSTPDYNISYPDLSFSNVNNVNINTTLGATYTQQIRVTNGGNGVLTAFYVALNPPSGMTFSGATNGLLNATGDTLFFDGPDLGVDELFTSGEEIISSYQLTINDCVNLSTTPAAAPRQCAWEYSERFISEIILPIDMNYFTGRVLTDDCAAQLNWQTQAEDNIAYFEVQRSTNGIAFEVLTKVKSVGTSRVLQNYEWKDSKTYQAGYYYRLAIVENGGGVRYSDYVYLSIPCGDTKGKMGVLSISPTQLPIKSISNFRQQPIR